MLIFDQEYAVDRYGDEREAEGFAEGFSEGFAEGFAEVRAEGALKQAKEIALRMQSSGFAESTISEMVNVDLPTVQQWLSEPSENQKKGVYRMEKLMYMMMIQKTKTYNRLTKAVVTEHVENIRSLDDAGKLEICGVFQGYPGMAGMYILKTENREEAEAICKAEPLVRGGFATYKLVGFQIANRENNYLL